MLGQVQVRQESRLGAFFFFFACEARIPSFLRLRLGELGRNGSCHLVRGIACADTCVLWVKCSY